EADEEANVARIGKDEMNLVEFPITLLTDRPEPGQNTVLYELPYVGKNGKVERAEVKITGSDDYGLPIAGDMDVYIVLMELAREQGFRSRTVSFSRYEILRRLKGDATSANGREY